MGGWLGSAGAKDILEMSGDTVNQIPSTLPHWGILMRSFRRDGQPLGRAVADQAKALMDRWKAIFQGNMDVTKPVQIKQLGPPPEQRKSTLLGRSGGQQRGTHTTFVFLPHQAENQLKEAWLGLLVMCVRCSGAVACHPGCVHDASRSAVFQAIAGSQAKATCAARPYPFLRSRWARPGEKCQ
jgi:hypothetical protein